MRISYWSSDVGSSDLPVADAIVQLLQPMPASLRRSITFDNGTEFTRHHRIERQLAIQAFFCDPHAPWQKGGIENAIGRSEEHTSELKSLMSISYAVFCLKKKKNRNPHMTKRIT